MPPAQERRPRFSLPPWLIALLVAFITGGTVAATITLDGDTVRVDVTTPATTPTSTKVDADADGKRDETLTVTPKAAAELDGVLDATTPAGEPKSELSEPLRGPDDVKDVGKVTGPLAADSIPGCRTRFVGNFSRRVYGPEPSLIFMHQTVSADRPGWGDQDALTSQANTRSSGTSWGVLVGGKDGLCTYTVPLKYSAWTQANANSVAIGIEVQAVGNEPQYCTTACRTTLMKVYREIIERYPKIKMRRGAIKWGPGCRPIVVRTGILEHSDGGSCAGGHADVTPWSIVPLIDFAARYFGSGAAKYADATYALSVLTAAERAKAKKLLAERRIAARRGGWSKIPSSHLAAATRAKAWLKARRAELRPRLSSKANRSARYRVIGQVLAV